MSIINSYYLINSYYAVVSLDILLVIIGLIQNSFIRSEQKVKEVRIEAEAEISEDIAKLSKELDNEESLNKVIELVEMIKRDPTIRTTILVLVCLIPVINIASGIIFLGQLLRK